jgi:hypothetical protein
MTNVEIMQQQAKKLLDEGKLRGRNVEFVSSIIKYNKKKLKGLSSKQYQWLRDIIESNENY